MSAALAMLVLLAAVAAALLAELRRRRELAARAAHDLRGPLTAARLALQLARRDAAPASLPCEAADATALDAADRELARAGDAVEDLERAARGRAPARRLEDVAVGALVAGQVEVWRPVALAAGRRLRLGPVPHHAVVPGDPRLLRRALANLVANALEHGGGDVTVSATRRGDRVRLEVHDGAAAARERGAGAAPAGGPARGAAPAGGPRPIVVRPASPLADVLRGGERRRGRGLRIAAAVAARHGGRLLLGRDATGTVAIIELPLPGAPARAARFGRAGVSRARPAPSPAVPRGETSAPPAGPAAGVR